MIFNVNWFIFLIHLTAFLKKLFILLQELETGIVDLLIPSPTATAEVGYNRDR